MRILVVTVVHVPRDARIARRQIGALLDAGHDVTFAAPWHHTGTTPSEDLRALDLPRAVGRRRLEALRAARRVVAAEAPSHDLVLLHDPELLLVAGAAGPTPVVWDVHEDTAAALVARPWVPRWLRRPLQLVVRAVERLAERRHHLLLAEYAYAARFRRDHPVVPNVPVVPVEPSPPGPARAVYLGRVARARGAAELVALGRHLRGEIPVEVIGDAEDDVAPLLRSAHEAGDLRWHGFLPNDEALVRVQGATAGLSLLHDLPNFRGAMPTKVLEYLACGVPVVTTPLPLAAEVVRAADAGVVVPFGDVAAAAEAVRGLAADRGARVAAGRRGHAHVARHRAWQVEAARFVALLEGWAAGDGLPVPGDG